MKHKRNIFIIDPQYQLKFCFSVLVLILLGSISFPLVIYEVFEKLIELQPLNQEMFLQARNNIFQYLLFSQICYLGISFVVCVYISHKTAGPIYKLKLFLKEMREPEASNQLSFREGDYFQDLASEVNSTIQYLKKENISDSRDQFYKYIDFISADLTDEEQKTLEIIRDKIKSAE